MKVFVKSVFASVDKDAGLMRARRLTSRYVSR